MWLLRSTITWPKKCVFFAISFHRKESEYLECCDWMKKKLLLILFIEDVPYLEWISVNKCQTVKFDHLLCCLFSYSITISMNMIKTECRMFDLMAHVWPISIGINSFLIICLFSTEIVFVVVYFQISHTCLQIFFCSVFIRILCFIILFWDKQSTICGCRRACVSTDFKIWFILKYAASNRLQWQRLLLTIKMTTAELQEFIDQMNKQIFFNYSVAIFFNINTFHIFFSELLFSDFNCHFNGASHDVR